MTRAKRLPGPVRIENPFLALFEGRSMVFCATVTGPSHPGPLGRIMLTRPILCLFGAFTCALPAQTTHVVGPAGLPQIRDALAIAGPGDLVLVQPGTYAHFTANVGVTIRAVTTGTVTVSWQSQFVAPPCLTNPACLATEGPTLLAPPPGQVVNVVGIDFAPNVYQGVAVVRHCVAVTSGTVTFDQCSIQSNSSTALWVLNATVHLTDCAVAGIGTAATAHGVVLGNSLLTALDVAIGGNSGTAIPGDGIVAINSTVHASNTQVFGGAAPAGGTGGAAVRCAGNSESWISDSVLVATNQCAVLANGAGGRIERTTQLGTTGCPTLPSGAMLSVDRPTPPVNGGRFTLRFRCDPNAFVAIFAGPGLQVLPLPGLAEEPLTLSFAAYLAAGVWFADATGNLSVTWTLPAGAPFVNQPLWFQAVGGFAFPLQVSPIAGGVVR